MALSMKPLLPVLKERKRYILFEVKSKTNIENVDVKKQVTKACLQFLGELGVAKSGVRYLPENYKNGKGIIRVGHKHVDEVKAALALITEIGGQKASVNVLKVSGVIDKVKE